MGVRKEFLETEPYLTAPKIRGKSFGKGKFQEKEKIVL